MRFAAAVALLLLAAPAPGGADVRHVPAAYPDIQAAIDASSSGDVVAVAPGAYAGFTIRDGVHVRSTEGSASTFLTPRTGQPVISGRVGADSTVVRGFSVQNARGGVPVLVDADSHIVLDDLRFQDCIVEGVVSVSGSVEIRNCRFERCVAAYLIDGWMVRAGGAEFRLRGSRFIDCSFPSQYSVGIHIYADLSAVIEIVDTEFIRLRGPAPSIVSLDSDDNHAEATIRRCLFSDCESTFTTVYVANNWNVDIQGNVFHKAAGLTLGQTFGSVVRNTFVANQGRSLSSSGWCSVDSNVFVGSTGASAVRRSHGTASCNIYWNNPDGHGDITPDDFVLDPLFCDAESGQLSVHGNSVCRPGNSFGFCGPIGALGAGCPPTRSIVNLVETVPPGLLVEVESERQPAPVLFNARPGAPVVLSVPSLQSPSPGVRHGFAAWEDGNPDTTRAVVGTSVPAVFTASFDTSYAFVNSVRSGLGQVAPPDAWYAPGTRLTLAAIPDSGWIFRAWRGSGTGSYGGIDPAPVITMGSPIDQSASFYRNEEIHIDTVPSGLTVKVGGGQQPYVTPVDLLWENGLLYRVEVDSIQTLAAPDTRYRFQAWSDGGSRIHVVRVTGSLSLTASFVTDHDLTVQASAGGSVVATEGWYAEGDSARVEAVAAADHVFTSWTGTGPGSYSGPDNPAWVRIDGPVVQTANFRKIAHELTLSLSATDPLQSTGAPLGIGPVHVWLNCSTTGGAEYIEADVAGSLAILGFAPAPGVVNGGDASHLRLALTGCPAGPVLLGSLFVQDPAGGGLCLVPSAESGALSVTGCTSSGTGTTMAWPADVRVAGVRTDGGVPCASGRACDEAAPPIVRSPGATASGPENSVVQTSEDRPLFPDRTSLEWIRPNPFADRTEFSVAVAEEGRISLSLFDVQGRRVRVLVDQPLARGAHRVAWDGRDARGRRAPAGVYFARLEAGHMVETRKVVRAAR